MSTNQDLVKGIYESFAKGDVPAVLGAFDPKIEWREAESFLYAEGNPYVGPESVAAGVFQRLATDLEAFGAFPERVTDGGDTVLVQGRYRGTMRSTGTGVDAQFAHVWEIRGGRVVRFQQYTDTLQWARAAATGA